MKTFFYIYCILVCIWEKVPVISGMGVEMATCMENVDDMMMETLNCSDTTRGPNPPMRAMLFDDEPLCCGNTTFQRGMGSADLKYFQTCNVEPKNATMSLEDSYWAFYECIIKKSLGSVALTQTSYAQLLAKNLSDSKKSAIMTLVNNPVSSTLKPTGNEQLTPIKKFWEAYFEAEYKKIACAFIQSGIIKEADLSNADLNFETLYQKSLPKFYSKSVKENVLQMFLEHTRIKYFNNLETGTSAGFQEIAKEMMKNADGMLGNLVSATKKNMYLNVITIAEIVHEVVGAIVHTCDGARADMDPIM